MHDIAGTGALVRLALRRDRVMVPIWLVLFIVTAGSSASATAGLYPTVTSRVNAAEAINRTSSLVALYGRIYDPTSLGAISMIKLSGIGAALVAVFTTVLVVRHTRAEEETGRAELLGATVVGRLAPLTAALIVAALASVTLGVLTMLALIASGLPVTGSIVFGLAWAGVGLAFAGVAGSVAQLTTTGRAAIELTGAVLALTYVARAVGDTAAHGSAKAAVWLSPIGWGQQARPFAGDQWPALLLLVGLAIASTAAAYRLAAPRDLGAGLLADRPGPPRGSPRLGSAFGLAWRLQRGSAFGWLLALVAVGGLLASIASNVTSIVDSPQAAEFIRALGGKKVLVDAFLAAELGFMAVFTSAYAVAAANRPHNEEVALRGEWTLATAVSRAGWAGSHAFIALAASAAMMFACGLTAGAAHAVQAKDASQVLRVGVAALVQFPAVAVFVGITIAAFGIASRATVVGWATFVVALLIGELGPLFKAPQKVLDLSPFAHPPKMPGARFELAPELWLLGIAAVLLAVGLVALRRRDIG